ncbi:hypothetical protein ACFQY7_47845 [Actinomadura luteofluorescens]|uniref:hypothetical protein n=1 Tax=Actinomadura luteofluorescens TaxID=46163 RepID=UPI00362D211B
MTTVVLVLLCLAIAGRELYLASDKRLPQAQAELRNLRKQLNDLARDHDVLKRVVDEATEPVGIPIPPPQPEAPASDVAERLETVTGRVERLEKQFGDLSDELSGIDLDRDSQHALARTLDAVEQDVQELHREMLDRLDREEGVVTGALLSEEGRARRCSRRPTSSAPPSAGSASGCATSGRSRPPAPTGAPSTRCPGGAPTSSPKTCSPTCAASTTRRTRPR